MASNRKYEFQCPQFVDFCSGIEGTSGYENNFGSTFPDKRSEFLLKSKCLIRKQHSQIKNLRSTPVNKQSFVNTCCRSNTTDSEKINCRIKKIFKRRSKSMDSVHQRPHEKEQEFFPVICRKRSISATDDRPKKMTRPVTPECLKRSLYRSKDKIFKTTEELELEKIAQLQKQTSNHLRANEVAMRRLKMKQACIMQKDSVGKETKRGENLSSGYGSFVERVSVFARNISSRSPREVAKGQCSILNSKLKMENHSNKMDPYSSRFIESASNLPGLKACLNSLKNEAGATLKYTEISYSHTNSENIQSMKFLRPPLKSRRCLFQENGHSQFSTLEMYFHKDK